MLLVQRPPSSTSLLQREMLMMKNGLYQVLMLNLNCCKLLLKSTESHSLPGPQNLTKASRKTISSQTSVKTAISVSLELILQIPRPSLVTSGTGLRPEPLTRRTTSSQTSEEIPMSTTPSKTCNLLKVNMVAGISPRMTGSEENEPYIFVLLRI